MTDEVAVGHPGSPNRSWFRHGLRAARGSGFRPPSATATHPSLQRHGGPPNDVTSRAGVHHIPDRPDLWRVARHPEFVQTREGGDAGAVEDGGGGVGASWNCVRAPPAPEPLSESRLKRPWPRIQGNGQRMSWTRATMARGCLPAPEGGDGAVLPAWRRQQLVDQGSRIKKAGRHAKSGPAVSALLPQVSALGSS